MQNETETRLTFKTPTSTGLSKPARPGIVTKFKSPQLIKTPTRPPTEYSSVHIPPAQTTQFKHHHTVKIESDFLAIVFLPTIISLLALMVLALTALSTQETRPLVPSSSTVTTGSIE